MSSRGSSNETNDRDIQSGCVALCALLFLYGISENAYAVDTREIGAVNILADSSLSVTLSEVASAYTTQNMVTIANSFGTSENQEKRIEDGETADIFITANPQLAQQLKNKGLLDTRSISRIVSATGVHYTATVISGDNVNSARGFLAFLKSDKARKIFKANGLTSP